MKYILVVIMLCAVSFKLSAQSSGSINMRNVNDSAIVWFDKFRPYQPWSIDVDYSDLSDSIKFGIIVSNFTNGSFGYYQLTNIIFPITLDPVADVYNGYDGKNHASFPFKARDITFQKFGIIAIPYDTTMTGYFEYKFKQ